VFFAGWSGPVLPGPHWLFIKMLASLFLFVWLRATLPPATLRPVDAAMLVGVAAAGADQHCWPRPLP